MANRIPGERIKARMLEAVTQVNDLCIQTRWKARIELEHLNRHAQWRCAHSRLKTCDCYQASGEIRPWAPPVYGAYTDIWE